MNSSSPFVVKLRFAEVGQSFFRLTCYAIRSIPASIFLTPLQCVAGFWGDGNINKGLETVFAGRRNSFGCCVQLDYMESAERIGSYDVYRQPSSTRWNPTSEQLSMLRELYYTNGIRSPTVDEIHRISMKLSRYGKIEGKNVFYWFQNHKARHRQKTRLSAMNVAAFPTIHTESFYENRMAGENSSCKEAGCCSLEQMYAVKHHDVMKAMEENQLQEGKINRHVETLELFPTHCEDRSPEPSEKKSCCWGSCETKENHNNNPPGGYKGKQRDSVLDLCLSLGNKSCGLHDN